jgi:hypothetical protein
MGVNWLRMWQLSEVIIRLDRNGEDFVVKVAGRRRSPPSTPALWQIIAARS